jgi:O-methyltransferase involved in polyketide biosynthesis
MGDVVNLTGVPETMLWTLHNRANEVRRRDAFLRDPDCVRVYESITYDFERSFGKPDETHPMRSRIFDEGVRPWLAAHRGGTVVELAAGLETQFQRCDDGHVQWLCVDVPEGIATRSRFLPPSERCRYLAKSALDQSWFDEVDASNAVFVTAQGLFMYLTEADVYELFVGLVNRFPGVELMFDAIPPWFSNKTLRGYARTKHYKTPPMPWGISSAAIEPLLRRWSPRVAKVSVVNYGMWRGFGGLAVRALCKAPGLRNIPPTITHVTTAPALRAVSR